MRAIGKSIAFIAESLECAPNPVRKDIAGMADAPPMGARQRLRR